MQKMQKNTLLLLHGLPGSGKSTFADEIIKNGFKWVKFEADSFFYKDGKYQFDRTKLHLAHLYCRKNAEDALAQGWNVIVSNTSTTDKEVQVYKNVANQLGANFVSCIVENRHEGTNVHQVPEETITAMKNRFSVKL